MEIREPKINDQEEIEKSFNLLWEFILSHPEIEPNLWVGAIWSILVREYSLSDMSYDQFCREWDKVKNHYKPWFNKEF